MTATTRVILVAATVTVGSCVDVSGLLDYEPNRFQRVVIEGFVKDSSAAGVAAIVTAIGASVEGEWFIEPSSVGTNGIGQYGLLVRRTASDPAPAPDTATLMVKVYVQGVGPPVDSALLHVAFRDSALTPNTYRQDFVVRR